MDAYDRKARLYPAAAVILPITVLALTFFTLPKAWVGLVAFLGAGGLHVPLTYAIRDLGARKQDALWKAWGGPPTTNLLRWSNADNKTLHARRHTDVQRATGLTLPTEVQEAANPADADATYETAIKVLRESTRDSQRYPLVKAEVTNYGYRRNLYGCRPLGIAAATAAALVELSLGGLALADRVDTSPTLMFTCAVFSIVWTAGWCLLVTPAFVRRDADRYAHALVGAASRQAADETPNGPTR